MLDYAHIVNIMHDMQTNMFPYRLAAIDIDDTLVGEDKIVSEANKTAIAELRRRGVHVMLASGRSHENILTYHKQLDLHGHIVSAQGALTRHAESGEVLDEGLLKPQDAIEAIALGQAHDLTIFAYVRGRIYSDRLGEWTDLHAEEIRHTEKIHTEELTELADDGFLKIIWAGDAVRISAAAPEATHFFKGRLDTAITSPHYLEFNAHGINKSIGIKAVAHAMNIPQHEVLAFGDGNNDIAMLAWAGMGIAMDTGRPAAKKAARRISPPGAPATALARAIHELLDESHAAMVA
jgi:Cof subfamily protein (haloacid dehalogenase superfamily)